MYKGDTPSSNDDNNDLDNLSGLSGIGCRKNGDNYLYYSSIFFSANVDEDNKNEDFPNLYFQAKGDDAKGDDLFNNQNIQPSDNQKLSPIVTELLAILGPKIKSDTSIRESKRKLNQINTIKRNLIQDIIPAYINESINDPYDKIRKIDPNLLKNKFKSFYDLKDLRLMDIYCNDLCKKEIKGQIKIDNNKRIIKNIEEFSDLDIKMKLKFSDVLKLFFNIETKLIGDFMKKGLQDYKQYFSSIKNKDKKKHKYKFLEKFVYSLNYVYMITKDNTKQSERTTLPGSKYS